MKTLFLLLAVATLALTGCKSHDNGMNDNGMNSNGMNNNGTSQTGSYSGGMPSNNDSPTTTH